MNKEQLENGGKSANPVSFFAAGRTLLTLTPLSLQLSCRRPLWIHLVHRAPTMRFGCTTGLLTCAVIPARLNIEYPMLFELTGSQNRVTHCGVLEFVADEGLCYLPHWVRSRQSSRRVHVEVELIIHLAQMMQQLLLTEGQLLTVRSATLPRGTYCKLQPVDEAFLDLTNPKAV